VYLYFVAASAAMAFLVQGEEELLSLNREDMFIADTAKLTQLFFEVQCNRKAKHGKQLLVGFKN